MHRNFVTYHYANSRANFRQIFLIMDRVLSLLEGMLQRLQLLHRNLEIAIRQRPAEFSELRFEREAFGARTPFPTRTVKELCDRKFELCPSVKSNFSQAGPLVTRSVLFLITARGNAVVDYQREINIAVRHVPRAVLTMSFLGMNLRSINGLMPIRGRRSKIAVMSQLNFAVIINLSQPFAFASANTHNVPVG
jgi:hypothetical protein